MKKFFPILFAALVVLSGMHISLATHICEGKIFTSKISMSGEKASCGMETSKSDCPTEGNHLGSDCCKDEIATYSVDNDYSPSTTQIKEITQNISQAFLLPVSLSFQFFNHSNSLLANVSPPDEDVANAVSLADICIFRI